MTQLHLPLSLEPNATFGNYYCSSPYMHTVLEQLIHTEQSILLSGPSGSGKTHLLQAICHHHKTPWIYIDCKTYQKTSLTILENMENQLICLDNIDAISNIKQWEDCLFKLMISDQRIILSSQPQICLTRNDLQSRVKVLDTYDLSNLDEEGQYQALSQRAQNKGLPLPSTVIHWMQRNLPRNNSFLFKFLDHIETESLRQQKKGSIQLAKHIWHELQHTEKDHAQTQR